MLCNLAKQEHSLGTSFAVCLYCCTLILLSRLFCYSWTPHRLALVGAPIKYANRGVWASVKSRSNFPLWILVFSSSNKGRAVRGGGGSAMALGAKGAEWAVETSGCREETESTCYVAGIGNVLWYLWGNTYLFLAWYAQGQLAHNVGPVV